jgi:HNH endonuclease
VNPHYTTVADRANHCCEYCRAPEVVFNFPFEVEHIIPLCKQGTDSEANLALACRSCNLRKGTRVSGIDLNSNTEIRFFHPRRDSWSEHFRVAAESGMIRGITAMGGITVSHLEMNSPTQIAARQLWIYLGLFP